MHNKSASRYLDRLIDETKVYFYKSRGPGGQRRNKKETAVKIHHIPTGIKLIATEFRSQAQNRELAFKRLRKKLIELNRKKKTRKPTVVPIGLKEEILQKKKIHSEIKRLRRPIRDYDGE